MRLLWAFPCLLALSCSKCDDRKTLRDLLSTPGINVKMSHVNIGEPQSAVIEVQWGDPPERCPKLDPDIQAFIDGRPAEAELGGTRKNTTLRSLRCDQPKFLRLDVNHIELGEEHQFILEDQSLRFEGRLRRVWQSDGFALPGPWPGPGGRWFVTWSGPRPREAVLGKDLLGVEPVDGGLELVLPDPLEDSSRLLLQFPTWEVSQCSFGNCEAGGIDFWEFTLDGGTIMNVEHSLY